MGFIKSTAFDDRELTTRDKWWYRIWKPLSDELIRRIGDAGWTTYSIPGTWTEHGSGYVGHGYRLVDGVVYLYGTFDYTSSLPITIFTLPVGYRPSFDMVMLTTASANTLTRMNVLADGRVRAIAQINGTGKSSVDLNAIYFPVG